MEHRLSRSLRSVVAGSRTTFLKFSCWIPIIEANGWIVSQVFVDRFFNHFEYIFSFLLAPVMNHWIIERLVTRIWIYWRWLWILVIWKFFLEKVAEVYFVLVDAYLFLIGIIRDRNSILGRYWSLLLLDLLRTPFSLWNVLVVPSLSRANQHLSKFSST